MTAPVASTSSGKKTKIGSLCDMDSLNSPPVLLKTFNFQVLRLIPVIETFSVRHLK